VREGGVARRATMLKELRQDQGAVLVLDAGRVFNVMQSLNYRERSAANVGFMKAIGYDAVGLNVRDFAHGRDFVRDTFADAGIPLLACNLLDEQGDPFVEPYVIKEFDGTRVAIIGVFSKHDARIRLPAGGAFSMGKNYDRALEGLQVLDPIESVKKAVEQIGEEAAAIIVLSQLPADQNVELAEAIPSIDLILTDVSLKELIRKLQPPDPGETRDYLVIGTTYILEPVEVKDMRGKAVAIVEAAVTGSGLTDFSLERKRVAQTIAEDPDLKKRVADFVKGLNKNPLIQRERWRKFVNHSPEKDPDSAYLGAAACAKCHQPQFAQWQTTKHAKALQTLVDDEKDAVDRCVACHATGFGWRTGFDSAEKTPGLAGIQCETCHGPGKLHAASPKDALLIRSNVQKHHCTQCHNRGAVPPIADFNETYEEYRAKIVH